MAKRMIETNITEEDVKIESTLRPLTFDNYIGQQKCKENLKVYIEAAKLRGDSLDHVLFYGPPGLGKTTLSGIIANEMGVKMKTTSGPAIEKPGEIAAILQTLNEGDVLFIDEIHRLNRQVEEILYPAMEDFAIDIMVGTGPTAKSIRLDLPKFTLVGATTRAGLLTAPLRDRFGVIHKLEFYTPEELSTIIINSAKSAEELKPLLNGYKGRVFTVDARRISVEALGKYFPNSPMLAAAVAVGQVMDTDQFINEMKASYQHKFAKKPEVIEGNMKALTMTLDELKDAL